MKEIIKKEKRIGMNMKRILSVVLAVAMVFNLTLTFSADGTKLVSIEFDGYFTNADTFDYVWAVVLKDTGEFIGDCGITIQNIDGEMLPEIGFYFKQ